jgi:hypothetical protein
MILLTRETAAGEVVTALPLSFGGTPEQRDFFHYLRDVPPNNTLLRHFVIHPHATKHLKQFRHFADNDPHVYLWAEAALRAEAAAIAHYLRTVELLGDPWQFNRLVRWHRDEWRQRFGSPEDATVRTGWRVEDFIYGAAARRAAAKAGIVTPQPLVVAAPPAPTPGEGLTPPTD